MIKQVKDIIRYDNSPYRSCSCGKHPIHHVAFTDRTLLWVANADSVTPGSLVNLKMKRNGCALCEWFYEAVIL